MRELIFNVSSYEKKEKADILHVAPYTHFITLPTQPLIFFCLENRIHRRMQAPKRSDGCPRERKEKKRAKLKYICLITRAPYTHKHTKGFIGCQQLPILQ